MKNWTYSDASICQVADMVCTSCRAKISEGGFRFRETEDAFLPQHRACSIDDPQWAAIDKRQQEATEYFARRKVALKAFIDEFGPPYDDLVDEVMAERSAQTSSIGTEK